MENAIKAVLIFALVLGLVFVAGCTTQGYSDYDTSTPVPMGGGCGISAPADSEPAQITGALSESSSF